MEENNKKLSEKTANENKSEVKINMFENNLNTFSEGEQMNRDYLVHLYNEDMSFLNKEIRMTRSGYIKMIPISKALIKTGKRKRQSS